MIHTPEVIDDILIVKPGTNTLINRAEDGSEQLDLEAFKRIGKQVLDLRAQNQNVILVTSGAITAGMIEAGLTERPDRKEDMVELQRLAGIGWRVVLNAWADAMPKETLGGLLLTKNELEPSAPERNEALTTTHRYLLRRDVPVANENDPISHEEIEFGDNDTLAATFAARIKSSELFGGSVRLVLLSNVDGVYENPKNKTSVIPVIRDLEKYKHLAGDSDSPNGSGGMKTKFEAAEIAASEGVQMWVANGSQEEAVKRALKGEIGTHFALA